MYKSSKTVTTAPPLDILRLPTAPEHVPRRPPFATGKYNVRLFGSLRGAPHQGMHGTLNWGSWVVLANGCQEHRQAVPLGAVPALCVQQHPCLVAAAGCRPQWPRVSPHGGPSGRWQLRTAPSSPLGCTDVHKTRWGAPRAAQAPHTFRSAPQSYLALPQSHTPAAWHSPRELVLARIFSPGWALSQTCRQCEECT